MNELALFAGVGGGMLGTQALGLQTVCAVELAEHNRRILIGRQDDRVFNPFPVWDDIKTFAGRSWHGVVDLVSGGFPCQAFSTAARGRNNAENLWPEMFRVVKDVGPEFVFAENVVPRAIEAAAEDLAGLGYKTEMLSLGAADLGADHIRNRYWLLAYANDKSQLRSTVNAKMASLPRVRQSVWEAAPDLSGMVDGVAGRVDRFTASGNGQVSVVAAAALWALANA